ncbi:hypothetical protein [Paraburkholderia terricola]|uniref:Uncharacterized protein n=1 Tax=Paraburkholderia terricola TaxID=169427 RepID=A0A1M6TGF5_9BURK|nr:MULTISPECIES: hypothetical protein [Paraburkholderia]SDO78280.1 hypothetical protein SAMN05192547_102747 [Paraburkholderia sediminicola]SHK56065.1 hypothetical protein SAMN05192548_102732 [Paraburkholderia terricola]
MTETSPPNEVKFIATRALELMGGREKAFAAMEADYDAMKERWNQDTDSIGRILRAHLYLEHYLTEYLQHANPALGDLDEARLTFAQKANLLRSDAPVIEMIIGGIRHLNKIRNRLAHNLRAAVTEEDANVFLSQGIFRAMREEDAKGTDREPSADPLDVLEGFAEFASAMLHNGTTSHGEAFRQATGEWHERHGEASSK